MTSLLGYTISFDWSLVINSWKDFNSTFIGAIAGAGVILAIDWRRNQYIRLSELNSALANLSILNETLLITHTQFITPLLDNYNQNQIFHKQGKKRSEMSLMMFQYPTPDYRVEIKTEVIQTYSSTPTQLIIKSEQLKRGLYNLKLSLTRWNDLAVATKSLPPEEFERLYFVTPKENGFDSTLADTMKSLRIYSEDCIHLATKLNNEIEKISKIALPFWLRKQVTKVPPHHSFKTTIENVLKEFQEDSNL